MVDPVQFEEWIDRNFRRGGLLDSSRESRALQEMMAEAVLAPEVTIVSGAVARTGVDEIPARMALALVYAFEHFGGKTA